MAGTKQQFSGYTSINQDEHEQIRIEGYDHAASRPWAIFPVMILKAVVVLLAGWGLLSTLGLTPSLGKPYLAPIPLSQDGFLQRPAQKSCRCGDTIEEARANNCTYDSLAAAYLPSHCIDWELLREWETTGPGPGGQWVYYADKEGTTPLTVEDVANLPIANRPNGRIFYTTMEWHIKHCSFSWRKQYRAAHTGVTIDYRSDGMHHIAHCEMMFLKRNQLQELVTRVGVSLDADRR